ncbi:tRNA (adenosine(37)-N6)-threonylcarbamoyltransferase complex dimerization subunit type 1 TsaB [Tessaracoccus sp. OH4464_COT-324]|uniref:tRNA (adenosine(37)-N6)-threonylcarbamoyltransferase complex dimerization subunit type 1 TsaB n=1 Tax=Tessaracoccus sp. OH4464_COT-324 TaxID=2491059 RepID=UPI000F639AE0|nr:tRNA (adenosine(37)-N6)-threonylcarbamoyltransferase complex dimerization subunit type 1 TsaB [Tessaracoccus sp. OH4464_COT-324]RRD46586.1 tRNA (adenosine(37)-N6)-threonylcarbamoyltransferase complex dimerization subunit type 1 TsaB [Tessaracoccus sp. OH4464_COT-324]
MITLAVDTSHHVAVGLAIDGEPGPGAVVADARAHVEELIPTIQRVLAEAGHALGDVGEFVVGMGPGPYTGLRVGIATAATLAYTAARGLHRVCSLDVLALGVAADEDFVVASDARRKELFWARYSGGRRVGEPQVGVPEALPELPVYGDIPAEYRPRVRFAGEVRIDCVLAAQRHAQLPVAGEEPYYLRAADAAVPGAPKSALPRLRVRR